MCDMSEQASGLVKSAEPTASKKSALSAELIALQHHPWRNRQNHDAPPTSFRPRPSNRPPTRS